MRRKFAKTFVAALAVLAAGLSGLWFAATQPFVSARPWSGESASPAVLQSHVRMLAETLPGRSHDVAKLNLAAEYIHSQFRKYGKARYQSFDAWGIEYRNVVVRYGAGSSNTIVVGAHYDTHAGLPGADDNASGVAGLLELARLLSKASPGINVELVAYALEELPHFDSENMGSYHHALASDAALTIVLEMIGYFRDEPGSQHYPLPMLRYLYSDTGNFIAAIGRFQEMLAARTIKSAFLGATDVPLHTLTFAPVIPGVTLSDHRNYWTTGQQAVMITDTAFERNPYYHTQEDTPETLDYVRMAGVIDGVYASLFALADEL